MQLCAHTYAYTHPVQLILKDRRDTTSSSSSEEEAVELDGHKMMAAHAGVALCRCDALPLQYVLAPLNGIAYWCNIMAKARWHNAMAIAGSLQSVFSDTKSSIPRSAPAPHNSCWEGEGSNPRLFSSPHYQPGRSERVPLWQLSYVLWLTVSKIWTKWLWELMLALSSSQHLQQWITAVPQSIAVLEPHLFF